MKPSKFALEAANKMPSLFPFPRNLMFSPAHIGRASELIDSSFNPLRESHEELIEAYQNYIDARLFGNKTFQNAKKRLSKALERAQAIEK